MYALVRDKPERPVVEGANECDQALVEKKRRKKPTHHTSKAKKDSKDKTKTKRDSKDKASKPKPEKERKHKSDRRRDVNDERQRHQKTADPVRREKRRKHKSKHHDEKQDETNHELPQQQQQQQQPETTCFCQKSLRALKPQDVSLFFPCCLPCICGKQQEQEESIRIRHNDHPYPLDEILRPWQAEFLENEFMVTTISELIASCEKVGPVMAREMKRWCKHSLMAPMVRDVQSCTLALFIWTKSCKMIMDSSKRPGGATLYKVKARDTLGGNNSSLFLNKSKNGDAIPKVVVIPPSCRDDDVSACSSQGASTVLEDFLENIFHWEVPPEEEQYLAEKEEEDHDKPKTIEIRKRSDLSSQSEGIDYHDDGWDMLTPQHDEYAPILEISNMEEVMVSLEMYECIDKTVPRAALEQKLSKMTSVLNRVNINLITTDSPPVPEDNKSMVSVGGSIHKERRRRNRHHHRPRRQEEIVYDDYDRSDGDDTTVTEPTTKSATPQPKGEAAKKNKHEEEEEEEHMTARARRPRLHRGQWHSSIAYLAAFDVPEDDSQH